MRTTTPYKKVLVVEGDNELAAKVIQKVKEQRFLPERAKSYEEALDKLAANSSYHHVVCRLLLTDRECFSFIGKVKEMPHNHPNFILPIKEFIKEEPNDTVGFESFLDSKEGKAKLSKALSCDFSKFDPSKMFKETTTDLKLSGNNIFPSDKTYLYDFNENELFIGARPPATPEKYLGQVSLVVKLKNLDRELTLHGKFEKGEKFDEDKEDVFYLVFKIEEDSKKEWKECLDLFKRETKKLIEFMIDVKEF
ncbi:MAG: hypothetical protein WD025_00205 [Bacteriovoracaceae bacterium]